MPREKIHLKCRSTRPASGPEQVPHDVVAAAIIESARERMPEGVRYALQDFVSSHAGSLNGLRSNDSEFYCSGW